MAAAQSCLRLQDEARRAPHTGETNTWEGDRIKPRRAPHTGETNTWEGDRIKSRRAPHTGETNTWEGDRMKPEELRTRVRQTRGRQKAHPTLTG